MNTTEIIMWLAIVALCFCVLCFLCAIRKLKRRVRSLEFDVDGLQWCRKRDYERIMALFDFIEERCQTEVGTAVEGFDEFKKAFIGECIVDTDKKITVQIKAEQKTNSNEYGKGNN